MEISNTYFYLGGISEDLKKECKEAILVKLSDKKVVFWSGYIWKEDHSKGVRWAEKNYKEANKSLRLYKVSDAPGTLYRNMVWFYGSKEEANEKKLEAIKLFINQENDIYTNLMYKATFHRSQVEFLESIKS